LDMTSVCILYTKFLHFAHVVGGIFSSLCFFSACAAKEFHFLSEAMTWTESQLYCRANFTDLATIENTAETNNINSIVIGTYSGLAWIGLYDVWTWSLKGSSFYGSGETEYRNWYPEPGSIPLTTIVSLSKTLNPKLLQGDCPCNY
uniref:C-type lectin domain-containing protein n=1 Tax=Denticeps clupeoides TaxID=299321 RepID=A0AAY4B7S6_9TELE